MLLLPGLRSCLLFTLCTLFFLPLSLQDRSKSRYRPPGWAESFPSRKLSSSAETKSSSPPQTERTVQKTARRLSRPRSRGTTQTTSYVDYDDYDARISVSQRRPSVDRAISSNSRGRYDYNDYQDYNDYNPRTLATQKPSRSRSRATTKSSSRVRYNDYSEYSDYRDFDYNDQPVRQPQRKPQRQRIVNRVTTSAPVVSYNIYDDYDYRDFTSRTRLTTVSPFKNRGRSVNHKSDFQRFDTDTERRNNLFFSTRDKYFCSPSDFEDDELLSSQEEEPPSLITVTHNLASGIFHLSSTSLELVPVALLQSTDISASPLIYYSASTARDSVVYSGLVAEEQRDWVIRPTCVLGRSTEVSKVTTVTQYSVQPVTQTLAQLQLEPALTQLLLSLLSQDSTTQQLPLLPTSQLPLLLGSHVPALSTTMVTSLHTDSTTYLTTLTETDTTLITLTFRGKELVSTLTSISTRELTATEFSTSTQISTSLVPVSTQAPFLLPPQITTAAPVIPVTTTQEPLPPSTYYKTHTRTMVTTATQEDTTVIPITFRGKAIETTVTGSSVVTQTQTLLSTETLTHHPPPPPPPPSLPSPDYPDLAPLLADLGLSLNDLDLVSSLLPSTPTQPLQSSVWLGGDLSLDDLDSLGLQLEGENLWDGVVQSGRNY